jgi:hypothetical protein
LENLYFEFDLPGLPEFGPTMKTKKRKREEKTELNKRDALESEENDDSEADVNSSSTIKSDSSEPVNPDTTPKQKSKKGDLS